MVYFRETKRQRDIDLNTSISALEDQKKIVNPFDPEAAVPLPFQLDDCLGYVIVSLSSHTPFSVPTEPRSGREMSARGTASAVSMKAMKNCD